LGSATVPVAVPPCGSVSPNAFSRPCVRRSDISADRRNYETHLGEVTLGQSRSVKPSQGIWPPPGGQISRPSSEPTHVKPLRTFATPLLLFTPIYGYLRSFTPFFRKKRLFIFLVAPTCLVKVRRRRIEPAVWTFGSPKRESTLINLCHVPRGSPATKPAENQPNPAKI
jgi:hypothetical protein